MVNAKESLNGLKSKLKNPDPEIFALIKELITFQDLPPAKITYHAGHLRALRALINQTTAQAGHVPTGYLLAARTLAGRIEKALLAQQTNPTTSLF